MSRIYSSIQRTQKDVTNDQNMLLGQIQVHHDFIEDYFQRLSKYQDEIDILGHEDDSSYVDATHLYLATEMWNTILLLEIWN